MKYWFASVFLLLRGFAVNGNMTVRNGRFAPRNVSAASFQPPAPSFQQTSSGLGWKLEAGS